MSYVLIKPGITASLIINSNPCNHEHFSIQGFFPSGFFSLSCTLISSNNQKGNFNKDLLNYHIEKETLCIICKNLLNGHLLHQHFLVLKKWIEVKLILDILNDTLRFLCLN